MSRAFSAGHASTLGAESPSVGGAAGHAIVHLLANLKRVFDTTRHELGDDGAADRHNSGADVRHGIFRAETQHLTGNVSTWDNGQTGLFRQHSNNHASGLFTGGASQLFRAHDCRMRRGDGVPITTVFGRIVSHITPPSLDAGWTRLETDGFQELRRKRERRHDFC